MGRQDEEPRRFLLAKQALKLHVDTGTDHLHLCIRRRRLRGLGGALCVQEPLLGQAERKASPFGLSTLLRRHQLPLDRTAHP